ncbi:Ankyrin repeat protein [Aspergillus clavatus NRRL 1]|uniref:Ankyrin repeat protein n=1 Tax=Aspergillus clavatus (strain ATCC 1007 / CBS 513.65 / DSM 816 / NCTC 3887 / NRRL 1 / QM 1276 / 107) TaxID=344612 RepID=A1C5N6_ASPCL|nr:Ankyrin repeat protein [Aspergillus clavatus NRRL 1]EAW15004.1 Ankyrin repeat protein [Aspergillus clavatus NRRL 1]
MYLPNLPIEVILMITRLLDYESEISALSRTNHRLYKVLEDFLYKYHVQCINSGTDEELGMSALQWAAKNGLDGTARRALEAGADPNAHDVVVIAASHGHANVVKVLLEYGADTSYERVPEWSRSTRPIGRNGAGNAFSLAASEGHAEVIRVLIAHGADPKRSARDSKFNPLIQAAHGGHLSIVKLLVEAGCDIEPDNYNGVTPLATAVANGHLEVVKFLLARGANPDPRCFSDLTPLCMAARRGHLEILEYLLDHGADPHPRINNETSLYALAWAAQLNHVAIVEFLMDRFDYLHMVQTKEERCILLCVAAATGIVQWAQHLLDAGLPPNIKGDNVLAFGLLYKDFTPLAWAADRGHLRLVELLIDRGANPSQFNEPGDFCNPLWRAVQGGHEAVVSLLLDRRDNSANGNEMSVALQHAVQHDGIFKLLLDRGADPLNDRVSVPRRVLRFGNAIQVQMLHDRGVRFDKLGSAFPLYLLAIRAGEAVFKILLQNRYDPQPGGPDEYNILQTAATKGTTAVMQTLLDRGFNLHVRHSGRPLLSAAASRRDQENAGDMIDLLLRHGARLNELDSSGRTPLMWVCRAKFRDRARKLLERGADPFVKGGTGETFFIMAARAGNLSVVKLLLESFDSFGLSGAEMEDYLHEAIAISSGSVRKALRQYYWREHYRGN